MNQPKVVVIGGGTGSFTLLTGIKNWTKNVTAIVNMSDDGGSSGELRDELGVLPPGDVRQCLVALSNNPAARDMFSYRFGNGKLNGHAVGNIILSALELQTGSFSKAVKIVADFMGITGQVLPVSNQNHVLVMVDGNELIEGEQKVSHHKIQHPEAQLKLKPKALLNPQAKVAISNADLVVIAPGDLYGSILPTLIVTGMSSALKNTKARVVMIANLINKPNQTKGWHVIDYLNQVERYIGKGSIDALIFNTQVPSKSLLNKYSRKGEFPVDIDEHKFSSTKLKLVGANLLSPYIFKQDPNDKAIKRTLIRHNPEAVTSLLRRLV